MIAAWQTAFAFAAMGLVGRLALGGRHGPGLQAVAGWGILCLALTLWGVLTPWSLRIPAGLFLLAALASIALTRRQPWRDDMAEMGRLLVIALPLLVVMAPMEPSQLDVFALILPNSAYLFDHGIFPTALSAAAHSDSPVAPYNTEIVPLLGSLGGGGFAPSGIAQFTVWLHLPAALLLGRALSGGIRPGWGMAAFGLLLATAINPGFVPRVSFAGYGEAPLAITLMFALWLGARFMGEKSEAGTLTALALVLAALINVKQQGIGLFLALGAAGAITLLSLPRQERWPRLRGLLLAALPALLLYVAWRAHVVLRFPEGEQITYMDRAWKDARLSEILSDMAWVAKNKAFQFGLYALVLGLGIRAPAAASPVTRAMLRLCALTIVFFNVFLVATFLLHFGREHSYFRYNTQLSLAAVLALVLLGADMAKGRKAPSLMVRRSLAGISLATMLAVPVAAQILLRFDRDQPQPQLRFLASSLAAEIEPDAHIALILPKDNSTSGMALESLLRHTHPRRAALTVTHIQNPVDRTLSDMAEKGFSLALVSCTDSAGPMKIGLDLPAHAAILLRLEAGRWIPVRSWTYPETGKRGKWGWTNFIAEEPFCMGLD
ncbi:hypothetical protein CCC_02796 [Paramagnetospirillum magnetotacticum MS-1]|uniref:Glycosyltransferase RgtA/B/C/D-like domain-containing protein n=1 Tax=Paramagnetospirillum magnetotacticum MS-1 TaxID=272627 RepID=A0A0C2UET0_PARME|nr:hypothetical protein [Paramagnetospirillum magnetotacticum]KIM00008.1 hypothetical protein CCC_02796 [Paramagnetospirillum magnetotacticum MS-1]